MLSVYAIAIFLCLASVAVGETALRLCGYPAWSQLAPAVGLSTLVALACAVIWLPGHQITAGVILALVVVGSAVRLATAGAPAAGAPAAGLRGRRPWPAVTNLTVGVVTLLAVSIPFVVNRHTGIFGVSIDDDFAAHLPWASSLFESVPGTSIFPGYPLGPHSLAASLAGLFGTDVEPAFTAILLAVPVLTALTAQALLREMTAPARVLGGLAVGLPYLVATHLGEGSFKELMMGLVLLGTTLTIYRLRAESGWRPRRAVVLGIMLAATFLIYGRAGVLWPVAMVGLWALAETAGIRPSRWVPIARHATIFVGVVLITALIASVSELGRLLDFSGVISQGGNVPTYTSPFQVLGVWFSGDFRTPPADVFQSGLFVGVALAVAAYAVIWWIRRRDLAIPAAAVSSVVIWIIVREKVDPYLASKPLVIAAPVVMLALSAPLLEGWGRLDTVLVRRVVTAAVGVVFVGLALWSSGLALRNIRVGSNELADELATMRAATHLAPTLDLVPDPFAVWELRGAELSSPTPYASGPVIPFSLRKPLGTGAAVDLDSIVPQDLDRFRYIVTTTSGFASEMPVNWQLVRATKHFQLWKRSGSTPVREILGEGSSPGALLDCHTPAGAKIRRMHGTAGVWAPAPVGPAAAWSMNGTALTPTAEGFVAVVTGSVLKQQLSLPPGRWEISLPYQSPADLFVTGGDLRTIVPSNLNILGPYWRIGELTSTGAPIEVTVALQQMRFDAAKQVAAIGGLAAVRLPRKVVSVPLGKACGRYVDWYRR
jgi:hypothetical protein